jgi:PEP-CTERM motif
MKKIALVLSAGVLAIAAPASATVVNFDDLAGGFGQVANGYNGLDWNNFFYLDGPANNPSGYAAGTVSTRNVAFNSFANPASITSTTDFFLGGAYLTAAWFDGLTIQVDAFNNGVAIWSQALSPSAAASTLFTFNNALVDEVRFTSFGGTQHAGYNGAGAHFALDNLFLNQAVNLGAVPEPASWALMIAGFGLVGSALRKGNGRRRKPSVSVSYV